MEENGTDNSNSFIPLSSLSISQWLLLAFLCLTTLATIFGNLVVILAIVRGRTLRSTNYTFILCLAVTDFTLGLTVMPFAVYVEIFRKWSFGLLLCNIWVSLDVMLCAASVLHIALMTIDRKLAIQYAIKYPMVVTTPRIIACLIIIWIISIGSSFIPIFLGWNTSDGHIQNTVNPENCTYDSSNPWYALIVGLITFIFPLLMMFVMYLNILMIARAQTRKIRMSLHQPIHNPSVEKKRRCPKLMKFFHAIKTVAQDNKATFTVFTIFGIFAICWLPYMVIYTFAPLFGSQFVIPKNLYEFFLWTGYINSAINPILYTTLNRGFRDEVKQMFGMKTSKMRASFLPDPSLTRLSRKNQTKS